MEKEEKVLFSRETIQNRVCELGKELSDEYRDKDLLVISLLRGSFVFAADLVREMDIKLEIDFLTTASYGNEETFSGKVKFLSELRSKVEGRDVLIVDDIMDTGHTMKAVVEKLKEENPKSIKTCVVLDKPSRREVELEPDYVAFEIPDVFIVGYGLNYGDYCRNVPYIYTYL
ncbi:hypoxanthine phosphoribosyltransferase [Peptoniphilus stercorisuis]|uniref:Hypoxanthine phosphoribosyltransferase n=1 Tax=Peptoniphilus stercorisuis TaxID=1436965 RepID=A0ABS4KDL4_9FIRM|nr:hypoxanthine phosphoribosyltransferase [Peptoniphilus stercorisuis]MBP2025470.1 hypoxanthine phosphoribosyltransferase [Peptoniphilus stercorisuis]